VDAVLTRLVTTYPDLQRRIYTQGTLARWVNVFVGEDDIRHLQGPATPLGPEAQLAVFPALAGG